MSKRSDLPQSRRHIWVYDEDWEWLLQFYGPESPSRLGVSVAIRQIVHRAVVHLRNEAQAKVDERQQQLALAQRTQP